MSGQITKLSTHEERKRWLAEGSDFRKGWDECHSALRDRIAYLLENPKDALAQLRRYAGKS